MFIIKSMLNRITCTACVALLACIFTPAIMISKNFTAQDYPNDDGTSIELLWDYQALSNVSVSDPAKKAIIKEFKIEKLSQEGKWQKLEGPNLPDNKYTDSESNLPGQKQSYRMIIRSVTPGEKETVTVYNEFVIPTAQWFHTGRLPLLLLIFSLSIAIIYYLLTARRGKDLFIRRINGLESMDEAVGRATEKGKPILFVPGIGDLDDIQTIAGLTILSQLAYKAAMYNADLLVPVSKSMVLSTAREIIKEAYLKAGKPDEYKADCVFYLTDDQFGYVAGIDGIMVREQPAANFFLGTFYAEALILAETGFGTGAMQTAGTAQPHQLPFFVVSCDYTLIGEELFAASAYLSKSPDQIGSLKGQDFGKVIVVFLILTGTVMEMLGFHWLKAFLMME